MLRGGAERTPENGKLLSFRGSSGSLAPMRPALRLRNGLLAVLGSAAATLAPSAARAEGGYVVPGFLFGPVVGAPFAFAYGGELSVMQYFSPSRSAIWLGAFAQLQRYSREEGGRGRWALGVQVGNGVGLELGVARRSGDDRYAATTDVHVGPYVSAGILTLALRSGIPVAHDPGTPFGYELGIQIGIKIPIPYAHPPSFVDFGPGRPLVVARTARVAALVRVRAWAGVGAGGAGVIRTSESASRSPSSPV